jgi:isopenicillin-N N-acyltransferase-like protein
VTTPHFDLRGSYPAIGRAHGTRRGARLRAFLADDLCGLQRLLPAPITPAEVTSTVDAYRTVISAALPDQAAEIEGLAGGAGITVEQAYLLQIRREILGYHRIPTVGDCTTYARCGPSPVLAQTIDLHGGLREQLAVLRTAPDGGRAAVVLSFGGQLGYLGVNDAGVAVGINLVLAGEWSPGIPPYLAVRHLLDHATSTDHAVELLRELPLAGSRSLTIGDTERVRVVEFADRRIRVLPGDGSGPAHHTNHFLHPDLVAGDELNAFARASSVRRLDACRQRLAEAAPATVTAHFDVLNRPPILVPDLGDERLERTVAAAVLLPGSGWLHLRRGDPATAPTESFPISRPDGCRDDRPGGAATPPTCAEAPGEGRGAPAGPGRAEARSRHGGG